MYTLIIIIAENLFLLFIAGEQSGQQSHCCSVAVEGGQRCFFVSLRQILTQSDPTCNPHFVYMCMCCHASLGFTSGCLQNWEQFILPAYILHVHARIGAFWTETHLLVSVFSQWEQWCCLPASVWPLLSHLMEAVRVCLLEDPDPEGQGFCQAGFSVDFTKVRFSICHLCRIFRSCQRTNTKVSSTMRFSLEIYECREDESTSPEEPLKWPITSEHNTPNTRLRICILSLYWKGNLWPLS